MLLFQDGQVTVGELHMRPLVAEDDSQALSRRALGWRRAADRGVRPPHPVQLLLRDLRQIRAQIGDPLGAHGEDLAEGGRGRLVDAELGAVGGERGGHADRMERVRAKGRRVAVPRVHDEDRVAQGLASDHSSFTDP